MTHGQAGSLALPIVGLGIFIMMSAAVRPVLPPDETRYLTVAWEMPLRGDFILPTVNFANYSDKPPLLFWLINLFWAVFGVSRLSALCAMFAISSSVIVLTRRFVVELYPGHEDIMERTAWLTLGNGYFIVYSGLILFDLLLTLCVLGAFLSLMIHARSPSWRWILSAGVCMGLGVLAKGPVADLFLVFPIAAYPFWRWNRQPLSPAQFWKASGISFAISLLVIAAWVVPVVIETNGGFAHSLVWEQTAGRISGAGHNSHARPFWFYAPFLLLIALPWIASPYAWAAHWKGSIRTSAAAFSAMWRDEPQVRLIALWIAFVFIAFSLIAGKQPHYIVPLLPAIIAASAVFMKPVPLKTIRRFTLGVLAVAIAGQAVASLSFFKEFDLEPLANVVAAHPGPVAVVAPYKGQFNFLARRREPVSVIPKARSKMWLAAHPNGMLVDLDLGRNEALPGQTIFSTPFRLGRRAAVAVEAKLSAGESSSANDR